MFWIRRFFLNLQSERTKPNTSEAVSFNLNRPQTGLPCDRACNSNITADHFYSVSAKKPIELWSSNQQPSFSTSRRVLILGNLQCCNSFTGKKIVSYIKAEDGPVFTVYSEVRYVAKHCNKLKLTRYSYTARVIFPYSNIQIICYAFKLTCKLKSYVSIPFTSTVCVK